MKKNMNRNLQTNSKEKTTSNIKLYCKYISAIIKETMEYKLSFSLMVIGRFLISFSEFIALFFLFSGFTQIKGYTYSDILLCFSVMQMSFAIAECFGRGFKVFSYMVKRGEFDRILLRPRSTILQLLGMRFDLGRIGPLATAVITLIIGIRESQIIWNAGRIFTLLFMILGGTLLFLSLFMFGACFCFFSVEETELTNVLTYGAKEHGKYPLDVYGKGLMKFGTYIIPYTLIQYYPLLYLLGKSDNRLYALYPFGVVFFALMCYGFWCLGVRNYKSCGS